MKCKECKGLGYITVKYVYMVSTPDCNACKGTGKVKSYRSKK